VIEAIGARRPEGAVHIFCDIDLIPRELARWQKAGYHPGQAIALDMFPGTDEVEMVVALRMH
jgi:tRNA/tmRNA/rRNA uracil-C5-methylase (TrmA/RlmC/RlmD family)